MNCLYNDCNLENKIDIYRDKLNNMIVKKNHNLLDKEIIQLSQELDILLYTYYSCKNYKLN